MNSSLSIVLQQGLNHTKVFLTSTSKQLLHFFLPKFDMFDNNADGTGNNLSSASTFWQQLLLLQSSLSNSSTSASSRMADFLLRHFDANHDGHISSSELLQMSSNLTSELLFNMSSFPTPHSLHLLQLQLQQLQQQPPSWWVWFSREWPLLDWKIGLFLWKTFGGLLLLLAILSVIPGRLHRVSARLLRWPVLGITYFLVIVELCVYIVIRLVIRMAEYVVARPKHRKLRSQMSRATSYSEWHKYASELDRSQKRDIWLQQVMDSNDNTAYFYNWRFILELMKDMQLARTKRDSLLALAVIQQCTRKNVGGVMNEDLFSCSNAGEPKAIVREFINETVSTLRWITDEAVQLGDEHDHDNDNEIHNNTNGVDNDEDRRKYEERLQQNVRGEKDKLWKLLVDLSSSPSNHDDDDASSSSQGGVEGGNNGGTSRTATTSSSVKDKHNHHHRTLSSSSSISELSAPGSITGNGNNKSSSGDQKQQQLEKKKKKNGRSASPSPAVGPSALSSPARPLPSFHREQVLTFLKRARAAYGRTALCLSGGAMLGLYHFGVVKALHAEGLLPHIISGTSAGSVVGAILCTRTDEELKEALKPEVLVEKLICFSRPWKDRIFNGILKTGNMFLEEDWIKLIRWFTVGDMTFLESYRRTGRILCITLSSTSKKSPPVLLNYLSAPNVVIASAVIASAAVPGFISPVRLRVKDKDGVIRYQGGGKDVDETFWDGSIQADLPVKGLSDMLNCQFFIASQCNPHIAPFFFNPKGGVGMPSRWTTVTKDGDVAWRGGFLLAALEMYLKTDMKAKMCFLNDVEAAVGFTSTMMTQDFVGSTTIVPNTSFVDFFKLFTNPTLDELHRFFQEGAVAAYGHLPMISLHYLIADALDACIAKLESGKRLSKMSRSGSSGDHGGAPSFIAGAPSFIAELLRTNKIERDSPSSDLEEDSDYEQF